MLLHIPLTIADGLRVGSSTTSTISAPLGSSSVSMTNKDLETPGGGGGGGGGDVSGGDEVVLLRTRELLLLSVGIRAVPFGGVERRISTLVFSISSSELRLE